MECSDAQQSSKGGMCSYTFFDKKTVKLQMIRNFDLPIVDLPPKSVCWLPIPRNMPTIGNISNNFFLLFHIILFRLKYDIPQQKALQRKTFTPYLGEEVADSGFFDEDELMDVSGDNGTDDITSNLLDDDTFVKLVEALIPYQQRSTDDTALSSNSDQDDIQLVDGNETIESLVIPVVPDAIIFRIISQYLPGKIDADVLYER